MNIAFVIGMISALIGGSLLFLPMFLSPLKNDHKKWLFTRFADIFLGIAMLIATIQDYYLDKISISKNILPLLMALLIFLILSSSYKLLKGTKK